MAEKIIELENLTKRYGSSRGIENVNLTVNSGVIFGLLGPNGAGKSTTIDLLLDFIRPTSGSVRIFGLDARRDALAIHRQIGFLAGDMALDPGLTGWQQLQYLGHLHGNFDIKYVRQLAKRLECELDRKFKYLSRGNRQKVGLIASLMHKPKLLILDEPTSGLDPLMQSEFNKIILEHKNSGGAAFISSHVLSEVQEICDEVTFIRYGKLVKTIQMSTLIGNTPQHFVVISEDNDLSHKLKRLSGVIVTSFENGKTEGTYSGDVNKLLRLLADYQVADFSLADSSLESVFLKYYGEEVENV